MKRAAVAVVGHVDHGKTSLVKTLTGIDTDTLKEERARGLTISLGFANRVTTSGQIHFIDAPGHSDFVRTTASGLSGVEAILLVVSAVDGVQAQTVEHVRLARLMGVRRAIVALSKSDAAPRETQATQECAIADLLSEYGFDSVPIVPCSAASGDGITDLVAALDSLLITRRPHVRLPGFYLPIDRVFSAPGAGTIVAGTLIGQTLNVSTAALLLPTEMPTSIRGLQIDGEEVASAPPGARVAVNLRGVDATSIKSGDVLCAFETFVSGSRFDVSLDPAELGAGALKHMEHVMVLFGTAQAPARIRLLSKPPLSETERFAQIEFSSPQVAYPGQRFVLRRPARAQTLLGGTVLNPTASSITRNKAAHLAVLRSAETGDPALIANALADRDRGRVDLDTLARLARLPREELVAALGEGFDLSADGALSRLFELEAIAAAYRAALTALHTAQPIRPHHPVDQVWSALKRYPPELVRRAEARLRASGDLRITGSSVALDAHDSITAMTHAQSELYHSADQTLAANALSARPLFETTRMSRDQADVIELLLENGRAVRLYNHALKQYIFLHVSTIAAAQEILRRVFPGGERFTTGQARAALKTNRKTIVPLLEHFDAAGVTCREDNLRHLAE